MMKSLIAVLSPAILILFLFFAPTIAHADFTDSFTNTNGTNLSTHNSNYSYSGTVTIQSNAIAPNDTDISISNQSFADGCMSIDETDQANNTNINIRVQGSNAYQLIWWSNQWQLQGNYGGSAHVIGSGNYNPNGTHTFRLCANGSTISAYLDSILLASGTDTGITGTGTQRFYNLGNTLDNLFIDVQDVAQVKIATSPNTSSVSVGSPFTVSVKVDGQAEGGVFNAARATVTVSSNLTVTGISYPTTNSCNFNYTTRPSTSDPSFAGAIFNGSSSDCTAYTLTLMPNAAGTGTVTFTNGSVKSYEDNSEIMTGVQNGSFTISESATPTPTPSLDFTITNVLQTYRTSFTLLGTKLSTITKIFVNGSDTGSTYPTTTTWEHPVTLALGANNFTLYGADDENNQTATRTITVNRHTLGDINGDGNVDLIDASLFAIDWDKTSGLTYNLSDMNDDGVVNLTDLSILAKLIVG